MKKKFHKKTAWPEDQPTRALSFVSCNSSYLAANVLDCNIVICEFDFQSPYYVYFRI